MAKKKTSCLKKLPRLKTPIITNENIDMFAEAQKIIEGHNMTASLSHLNTLTTLCLPGDLTNPISKAHEFIMLSLEDNCNPDASRYVVGMHPNASDISIAKIVTAKDWLIQRRKITKPFRGGRYPLVFAPSVGGILVHEIIGHQFELSKAHSPFSPTKYKRGEKLFSDNLTVIDAPLSVIPTENFDDEGTIKKETVLIKNGAIMSPLADTHTLDTFSNYVLTGNCRRESYLHCPEPRMYSTYVENGLDSITKSISAIEYGFYVEQISYAFCNHRAGTVKLCVGQAKIIKHGKITDTPAIFFVDEKISSFTSVKFVCNDKLVLPGYCHSASGGLYAEFGSPTIGFDNINIIRGFGSCIQL